MPPSSTCCSNVSTGGYCLETEICCSDGHCALAGEVTFAALVELGTVRVASFAVDLIDKLVAVTKLAALMPLIVN
jgi:hypothetical protein